MASPCTASLVFSSQSLECQDSNNVDSSDTESQADSTTTAVAKHDFATIKINGGDSRSETPALKASSGGGYIRGRGDFAIQTPPPYEKKEINKAQVSPPCERKQRKNKE